MLAEFLKDYLPIIVFLLVALVLSVAFVVVNYLASPKNPDPEKLLAAHRAGVKKVLIPKENEKDLVDVPKKVKDDIEIVPVETADEVIKIALTKELKPTEWTEVDKLTETKKDDKSQASIQ